MSPSGNDENIEDHPGDVPPAWGWGSLLPVVGRGRCYQCRRPWWATRPRIVHHEPFRGQYALCVRCWRHSPRQLRRQAHWWTCLHDDTVELWPRVAAMIDVADDGDGFLSGPEMNYVAMLAAGVDLAEHDQWLTRVQAQNPDCLVTAHPTGGLWMVPRAHDLHDAVQRA